MYITLYMGFVMLRLLMRLIAFIIIILLIMGEQIYPGVTGKTTSAQIN